MSKSQRTDDENSTSSSGLFHGVQNDPDGTPPIIPSAAPSVPSSAQPPSYPPILSSVRLMTLALVLLAFVAFTWLGRTLADVLAPALFAMFLCYMTVPLVNAFSKIKVPRVLGYIFALLIFAGLGFGVGAMISGSVGQFQENFPAYEKNLKNVITALQDFAHTIRILPPEEKLTVNGVMDALPAGGIQGVISGGASYMFGSTSFILITLFFMIFMVAEGERFDRRVNAAYDKTAAERILSVTRQFNDSIQRYLVIKTAVSALTGVIAYIIFASFKLDFAGVLAVFVFLSNFVPFVGSIVSTVFAVLVALLQFPTWKTALFILIGITITQQVLGNWLEPRVQGRGLNVSPLLILLSLVYFSWMWGIVGMIVCMPVAAGVRILLDEFERTRPLAKMMSDI